MNGRNGWWNESKDNVSLFRKKYRACWLILCLHDDLKNVGTMRIDWNDRSKKKIRRCWQPSCIAEPRFVKLFLWSSSLSSSISNPLCRLNPHWLKLGDGGSDAPRRWCVTVWFCFVQICWRWQSSILINFNCVPLPLGSESIHRAAPMHIIPYNPFTVESFDRQMH